jgi:hypothetical protein
LGHHEDRSIDQSLVAGMKKLLTLWLLSSPQKAASAKNLVGLQPDSDFQYRLLAGGHCHQCFQNCQ